MPSRILRTSDDMDELETAFEPVPGFEDRLLASSVGFIHRNETWVES